MAMITNEQRIEAAKIFVAQAVQTAMEPVFIGFDNREVGVVDILIITLPDRRIRVAVEVLKPD